MRQTVTDGDLSDVYLPFYQAPSRFAPVLIRTARPPSASAETLRDIIRQLDSEVLVAAATSLDQEADSQLAGTRFLTWLLTGFAAFATFLVLMGI